MQKWKYVYNKKLLLFNTLSLLKMDTSKGNISISLQGITLFSIFYITRLNAEYVAKIIITL